jgi:hypothetical protein
MGKHTGDHGMNSRRRSYRPMQLRGGRRQQPPAVRLAAVRVGAAAVGAAAVGAGPSAPGGWPAGGRTSGGPPPQDRGPRGHTAARPRAPGRPAGSRRPACNPAGLPEPALAAHPRPYQSAASELLFSEAIDEPSWPPSAASTCWYAAPRVQPSAAGAAAGPRASGQPQTITVPSRRPNCSSSAIIGRDGAAGRIWHARVRDLQVPLASGSRRAATDRYRDQHDPW